MNKIQIGNKLIGDGEPCFLIAEVAQAHDGSLGFAHSFIDAAADAGADAVKFQTHIAEHESSLDETFRVNFSYQDKTRFDYWKRMEFSEEQWLEISNHCRSRNIVFLSSAFSIEAIKMLNIIGMPAWKVGSGEFFSNHILNEMKQTNKPILLSTGMANWNEISNKLKLFKDYNNILLFQTTSKYPTPLNEVGLDFIEKLKSFGYPVGLSDHSGVVYPSVVALSRKISSLEIHVTFHKKMFGPDTKASITFEEFEFIKNTRDAIQIMDNSNYNKDMIANNLKEIKYNFTKSASPNVNLKAGEVLKRNMISFKKPGTGIKENDLHLILGKKLKKDINSNQLFTKDHFHED